MTIRRQLIALGVPARRVPLATPYMFFSPMTVAPRAAGVREIVSGLQRQLRAIGFSVDATGLIDVATTRALDWLVPPAGSFAARSFSELATLVLTANVSAARARSALGAWEHGRDKSNCVGLGPTKATFVRLQRGMNRLSSKLGTPRVKADGIIGKTTVNVAKAIASRIYNPPSAVWASATCVTLANQAGKIAKSFHEKADELGAPAKVKGPSRGQPSIEVGASAPVVAGAGSAATPLLKFAPYVLIAGGVAFLAIKLRSERG